MLFAGIDLQSFGFFARMKEVNPSGKESMRRLNRRQFLMLTTSSAATLLLARCAESQPQAQANFDAETSIFSENPSSVRSSRVVEFDLEAQPSSVTLGDRTANLFTYNGQVPGPRLQARPGDTVRIRFTNRLSEPTNLHYHGLHIPPTGTADNIYLNIGSGQTFNYEFTLPTDHPAGTFFYHPHLHRLVADQVFRGLGGIFVVRGALDEIPEVKAAQEEFVFLKDFEVDSNGQVPNANPMQVMQGREGSIVTVNGKENPTFSLPTGGLLRLRMVNASTSRFYRLALENHPLHLIATDAGAIAAPVELQEILLSPGERAEVLVQGNQPAGAYRLLNLPYDRGMMGMMGQGGMGGMRGMGRMGGMSGNTAQTAPQVLATIQYSGSTTPLPLPQQLLPIADLPQPATTRRIELSMGRGGMGGMGRGRSGMGMAFLLDGKSYDHDRLDATVRLDTVEEWEIANTGPMAMDHPFHLHVNPFQVISRNGQPEPYAAWKDTVLVRANETVRIRVPFRNYPGKTVYHCHIFDHEDQGMMATIAMQA